MKTYLRSFVATIVLIGAFSASSAHALLLEDMSGGGAAAAPAAAAPTSAASAMTAPTSADASAGGGFTQSADSAQANKDAADKAKKDKDACEAPKSAAPAGPDQAADQAAGKAAAAEKCKTASVNTPAPQGAGTQIATKDPTSAKDALFSNQLTGQQTGGFSTDNKVPSSKAFVATADSAAADTKFQTIKTTSIGGDVNGKDINTMLGGKSDVLTATRSVNYQNYDANRQTRLVNSSDNLATDYGVAAKNNPTIAVGMPVDSSDPRAPLRQAFMNTMINKYGWSPEKAAAFAGNLEHESGAFDPQKLVYKDGQFYHSYPKVMAGEAAQGDPVNGVDTSFGVAQFHKDRADAMFEFVGAKNGSRSELAGTMYDQWDYVAEVDAPKTLSKNTLAQLDSPNVSFPDKVKMVINQYEIPAKDSADTFNGKMGGTNRYNGAVAALNEYGKETGTGGNYAIGAASGKGDITTLGGGGGVTAGLGATVQQLAAMAAGGSQGAINSLVTAALGGNTQAAGVLSQLAGASAGGGASANNSNGQYAGTETTDTGTTPYKQIPLTGFELVKAREILKTCGEELPSTDDAVMLKVARCKALGGTTITMDDSDAIPVSDTTTTESK